MFYFEEQLDKKEEKGGRQMELNQWICKILKDFLEWATVDPWREITFKKEKEYFIFTLYSKDTGYESVFIRSVKEAQGFDFEHFLSAITLRNEQEKIKELNEFSEAQRKKRLQRREEPQKIFKVSDFE